jgi:NADH:ubiquinone oxidoreductase subunit E
MSDLFDEVQKLRKRYPDWHSATLPALQLAQEKHGHLSPEALRECADALGTTPAICAAVASFYDMLHLAPVGRHMVEVCTNVSCALVGAQQVLERFEEELGIAAGETTPDGTVTLRPVECRRLRLGDDRLDRRPSPHARAAGQRAGDRRGAPRWRLSSFSRAPASAT